MSAFGQIRAWASRRSRSSSISARRQSRAISVARRRASSWSTVMSDAPRLLRTGSGGQGRVVGSESAGAAPPPADGQYRQGGGDNGVGEDGGEAERSAEADLGP